MLRPRVSLAARRRPVALILFIWIAGFAIAGLGGCTPARTPLPLDDDDGAAAPQAREHPDAEVALANAPAHPSDAPNPPPAPPPVPQTLSEEALPEIDVLPPPPPTSPNTATWPTSPNAPTAPNAPAPTAIFPIEAPSPLASIGVATPPNVAAATRLAEAAGIRLAAGDDAAALEQLERAIAIDSGNPYAYFFLATLHLRNRTYDQAIAFAERAASLNRPGAPEWTSRAYALQGNAFESAGRFSDARKAYARAVQAAPNNLSALAGLTRTGAPAPNAVVSSPP
ncbi:MAG: tetratricopeptide repeat protein [bacterium]